MDGRPEATSDLEREIREAEEAQAEAEAAAERAAVARAEAEAARRRAFEEREAVRRAWASEVIDAYDRDLSAAEGAVRAAAERFAAEALNAASTVPAYVAWGEAVHRHHAVQVRVAAAAPLLGMEASPPELLPMPPLSDALDAAVAAQVEATGRRIRAEAEAEVRSNAGPNGEASAPPR